MTRDQQIQAFLASRGATKCAPTTSHADNATPLYRMRKEHEARLATPAAAEVGEELFTETVTQARAAGMSTSDALDEGRSAVQR